MTEHQAYMLSMLKALDTVCKRYSIPYMLFAGTALGAVRHGGFIPWDDDLDVILLRADYERLLDAAARDLDSRLYYLQRENSPHWPMQFSKLRLNGTTCMEKYHPRDTQIHQGVYIDIFPCDALSDHPLWRRVQFLASKVVIAKALYARGYETNSRVKRLFLQFCRLLPREPFQRLCVGSIHGETQMVHSFLGASSRYRKSVYPRCWFTETVLLPFEDAQFPVSAHYDALLTTLYGDYMTPLTPEQRVCKEHVAILDLHRPYTDYLAQQSQLQIDTYTRSIR